MRKWWCCSHVGTTCFASLVWEVCWPALSAVSQLRPSTHEAQSPWHQTSSTFPTTSTPLITICGIGSQGHQSKPRTVITRSLLHCKFWSYCMLGATRDDQQCNTACVQLRWNIHRLRLLTPFMRFCSSSLQHVTTDVLNISNYAERMGRRLKKLWLKTTKPNPAPRRWSLADREDSRLEHCWDFSVVVDTRTWSFTQELCLLVHIRSLNCSHLLMLPGAS